MSYFFVAFFTRTRSLSMPPPSSLTSWASEPPRARDELYVVALAPDPASSSPVLLLRFAPDRLRRPGSGAALDRAAGVARSEDA